MQNLKLENNIYMDILLNKPEGKIARQYLNKRNISKNTAIIWKLGYCPANLVPSFYQNEKYNFWKKLYGRLTIPIYNQNNELVSISGRKIIDIVDREKNPKYDHYHVKLRHILFGLNINKFDIFKENTAIITEGQLDVITAWQNNIKFVVSSFGAHLKEEQLILLSRYTNNINILYDNDFAGQEGMNKIKQKIHLNDLNIKFKHIFQQGQDLDEYLQTHNKQQLLQKLNFNKLDYLNILMNKIKNN